METEETDTVPPIDKYCNNDALGLIFEFTGGFDLLATIPFVCKRWRKVARNAPLQFTDVHGWAFAIPDPLLDGGYIDVGILACTENREFIPYSDLSQNDSGLHNFIESVYWFASTPGDNNSHFILGTMKFSDDIPSFYFVLEQHPRKGREIVLHSNLFELLSYGTSDELKQEMKSRYFDKLQYKRIEEYKCRRRKRYR